MSPPRSTKRTCSERQPEPSYRSASRAAGALERGALTGQRFARNVAGAHAPSERLEAGFRLELRADSAQRRVGAERNDRVGFGEVPGARSVLAVPTLDVRQRCEFRAFLADGLHEACEQEIVAVLDVDMRFGA